MYHYFSIKQRRKVVVANTFVLKEPVIHESRTLSDHVFMYIADGALDITQNNNLYTLTEGDLIILHAGQVHYGVSPCAANTKKLFVHINSFPEDFCSNNFITPPDDMFCLETVTHCKNTIEITKLFKDTISTRFSSDIPDTLKELKMSSLFDLILCELQTYNASKFDRTNTIAQSVMRLISSYPGKFFTTKELADILQVSTKTIEKHIKQQTQLSCHKYQLHQKINRIMLIMQSDPSITLYSLAITYGFCDEFHLSKVFKKIIGISPKEYKKTIPRI